MPGWANGLAVDREHLGSVGEVTHVVWPGVSLTTSGGGHDLPKIADATCELSQDVSEKRLFMPGKKTAIVTGASGGIGAGLVEGFLGEGYNVVATSRDANQKLTASGSLVLLNGDIGKQQTAADAVEAAISNFGTIDVLVNNAGIFLTKPFTDFTTEDFNALVSTNLLGFLYITQRVVKEMLKQKSGCVVSITAALADRPIAGENGSVSMITKGGLNSATQNLAIEYAKDGIRFNAVAPGVVDTPMHRNDPKDSTLQPIMNKATVKDIVDAVLYLVQAGHVSGEILHVDGAAPARHW
jgi:NAD(P)-dependent dehydrogenase (short-subunit alcohol dehydrogenase family)